MEIVCHDVKALFYAFPGKTEVKTSDGVITCSILVFDQIANC